MNWLNDLWIPSLTIQAGLKSACRTGAHTSTWPSPVWSCCVLSGGRMRLEVFWQVMSDWPLCGFKAFAWTKVGLKSNSCLPFTGLISEVELGAQSVVYELANVAYMVISLMWNNISSTKYWIIKLLLWEMNRLFVHAVQQHVNIVFVLLVPFGFQHSRQCKSWKCLGSQRHRAGQALC